MVPAEYRDNQLINIKGVVLFYYALLFKDNKNVILSVEKNLPS